MPLHKTVQQLQQNQRVLQFAIFTLVTVLIWVGFSLNQSQEKTKITPQQQTLALPLNPTINQEILDELEAKEAFSEEELMAFPIYRVRIGIDGKSQEIVDVDTPDLTQDERNQQSRPNAVPTPAPVLTPTENPVLVPESTNLDEETF